MVIIVILALSFTVIFTCEKMSLAKVQKYPLVSCASFEHEYEERAEAWQKDAVMEYSVNNEADQRGEGSFFFSGALMCFCEREQELGARKDKIYEFANSKGEKKIAEPICLQYSNDVFWSGIIGYAISFIVIAIN